MEYIMDYIYILTAISGTCLILEWLKYFSSEQFTQSRVKFHQRAPNYSNAAVSLLLLSCVIIISKYFNREIFFDGDFQFKITLLISGHVFGSAGTTYHGIRQKATFLDFMIGKFIYINLVCTYVHLFHINMSDK